MSRGLKECDGIHEYKLLLQSIVQRLCDEYAIQLPVHIGIGYFVTRRLFGSRSLMPGGGSRAPTTAIAALWTEQVWCGAQLSYKPLGI